MLSSLVVFSHAEEAPKDTPAVVVPPTVDPFNKSFGYFDLPEGTGKSDVEPTEEKVEIQPEDLRLDESEKESANTAAETLDDSVRKEEDGKIDSDSGNNEVEVESSEVEVPAMTKKIDEGSMNFQDLQDLVNHFKVPSTGHPWKENIMIPKPIVPSFQKPLPHYHQPGNHMNHMHQHHQHHHIATKPHIPPPATPIINHGAFLKPAITKPAITNPKTYWEMLQEHIKNLESKLVINQRLAILEEYKKKLSESRDQILQGLRKNLTITVPKITKQGLVFEKKEFSLF